MKFLKYFVLYILFLYIIFLHEDNYWFESKLGKECLIIFFSLIGDLIQIIAFSCCKNPTIYQRL